MQPARLVFVCACLVAATASGAHWIRRTMHTTPCTSGNAYMQYAFTLDGTAFECLNVTCGAAQASTDECFTAGQPTLTNPVLWQTIEPLYDVNCSEQVGLLASTHVEPASTCDLFTECCVTTGGFRHYECNGNNTNIIGCMDDRCQDHCSSMVQNACGSFFVMDDSKSHNNYQFGLWSPCNRAQLTTPHQIDLLCGKSTLGTFEAHDSTPLS
eukprot:TRINITY_DN4565_c0_g1_i1.p1 TRINITY_DN4565_c0_g1~~TRINITY_DN4565_c0_g1_i1.p1  ORF type:complete len:212 (+),score=48.08 TRINITY_DN4565_c0_g1_i1:21-656(+)